MTKVGNKRRTRIDGQKNFFQNRVRYCHAIVRRIFGVLIVQSEIKRRERELASVENTGVGQLGVVHFLNYFCWNFFRWIAVIGRERVEHLLVPDPVLQHLRGRFDKVTWDMSSGETAVLSASDNRMQSVTKFVEQGFHVAVRQQRWFVCVRRWKITDQCNGGPLVFAIR